MKTKYSIKAKPLAWALFFFIFSLSEAIVKYYQPIKYLDEATAIFLGAYYVYYSFKKNLYKWDVATITTVLGLILLGCVGNTLSDIHIGVKYILYDMFNIFKYILAILGAGILFTRVTCKKDAIHYLSWMFKVLIIISTVFGIINLFADVGMYTDIRHGFRCFNFIFKRVGSFYDACMLWTMIITADNYFNKSKSNAIFIILSLLNMLFTLRTRVVAFMILYALLFFVFFIQKKDNVKLWYLVPFGGIFYFFSRGRFADYFTGDAARNVLLKYGIITAKAYSPFGAGFGTYGTAIAQKIYSPLYYRYHFPKYYGLSPDFPVFLTDTFWPAVMAEFGFIGTGVMALLIIVVFEKVLSQADNKYSKLCVWFAFGALFISSLGSSSFFGCTRLVVFTSFVCALNPTSGKAPSKYLENLKIRL